MQKLRFVLMSLISSMLNVQAADEGPTRIELSFSALANTPYVIEMAGSLSPRVQWSAYTNAEAGPARNITVSATAGERERYFRLWAQVTNGAAAPVLNISRPTTRTTNSIVIPAGAENSYGNRGNSGLFGPATDYQTFYSRSNFTALRQSTISILGIAFRLDWPRSYEVDVTVGEIYVWLSTFTKPSLSKFPSENLGADRKLVYSVKNIRFTAMQSENQPGTFPLILWFQDPFLYNSSVGDLLMEFVNEGPFSGRTGPADAVERTDGSVYTVLAGQNEPLISPHGAVLRLIYSTETPKP